MIYFFEGENKLFLKEKFLKVNSNKLRIYVWKNVKNQLGFDITDKGILFLKRLVSKSNTIIFPNLNFVTNEADIDKQINNFKGVSFWDKKEDLSKFKMNTSHILIRKRKMNY